MKNFCFVFATVTVTKKKHSLAYREKDGVTGVTVLPTTRIWLS